MEATLRFQLNHIESGIFSDYQYLNFRSKCYCSLEMVSKMRILCILIWLTSIVTSQAWRLSASGARKWVASATLTVGLSLSAGGVVPSALADSDGGASDTSNTKIKKGGASTLQAGIAKTITRGVNLDRSDFHGQNLKGTHIMLMMYSSLCC